MATRRPTKRNAPKGTPRPGGAVPRRGMAARSAKPRPSVLGGGSAGAARAQRRAVAVPQRGVRAGVGRPVAAGRKVAKVATVRAAASAKATDFSPRLPHFGKRAKDKAGAPSETPAPRTRKGSAESTQVAGRVRIAIIVGIVVAAILLVVLLGYLLLSYTPAFTITHVRAQGTEHVSAENVEKLAGLPEGSTLLNLDEDAVVKNLRKNPWVGNVTFEKQFPDSLNIVVEERRADALVVMSTGDVAWYLSSDNTWIEPVTIQVAEGQSRDSVALAMAQQAGAVLVTDVPSTVSPVAGSTATDDVLKAVESYRNELGQDISSQIVSFSASSLEGIRCTLSSGVEIALGSPSNISSKESVIKEILDQYAGKITYINVRVPSKPSFRKVDSDYVGQGSGTSGTDYAYGDPSASSSAAASSGTAGESRGSGQTSADGDSTSGDGTDGT
ncbi:cell division protein FtsQ [Olsenella sp. KH1P3]|uniref:Cell division protein FtsQ n=2 Tax=Coriobacteriales TaxID=84999 RepID=A0A1H6IVV5_9ACTN|nr:cell division protein FtsQ [Parafannyhessea umbonata]SJZ46996.1 cell division protein FtsQ [Olsenella sp. KH1P3]